jgi:hypothetical protein
MISLDTPSEVQIKIAAKAKESRIMRGHSRMRCSELSGIPAPTLRRFEDTGQISLTQFLMLVRIYGDLGIVLSSIELPKAKTMDELIKLSKRTSK